MPPDPEAPAPPPSRRILVIEDNPDGREVLRLLLGMWGHHVEVEEDGHRGLGKALSWRPEVAVVDIGLPFLDGYEVARRVRAALGRGVLLIALTGYGSPEDRALAFAAGFDHHVTKPADPEELQRLLAAGWAARPPPAPPEAEHRPALRAAAAASLSRGPPGGRSGDKRACRAVTVVGPAGAAAARAETPPYELPRLDDPVGHRPGEVPPVNAPAVPVACHAARRVLVVDADPQGRAALQQHLQAAGIEVEVAGDGPRGVQRALAWRPHAALVALGLPPPDGFEVARRLRAALGEAITLIALTGGHPGDRERAALAGFDVYMTSCADWNEVLHIMARVGAAGPLAKP